MNTFKLSLRAWKLQPLTQAFSVFSMAVVLLVSGFLFWFSSALDPVMNKLKSEKVVTVYVDNTQETVAIDKTMDAIRVQLGSAAKQLHIEEVSSDKFVTELEKNYPEMSKEIVALGSEAKQILPHYMSIRGAVDTTLIDSIKKVQGVESVDTSASKYRPIIETFSALKWILRIIAIASVVALFVLLFYTARLNFTIHQEAMELVRQLGGTAFQAKSPQMIHQLLIGIAGGALAAVSCVALTPMFVNQVQAFSPYFKGLVAPGIIFATSLMFAGAVCGWLSSVWVKNVKH